MAYLRWCDRQRELALQELGLSLKRRFLTPPRSPRLRNPDQLRRGERYPQRTILKESICAPIDRREKRGAGCRAWSSTRGQKLGRSGEVVMSFLWSASEDVCCSWIRPCNRLP